ncbi:MAG: hypothetical protein ABR529_07155 [Actinomycetota bacterium]
MCSSHATVRGLLHEIPADDRVVVVDTEASPEHLSRGTTEAVDVMLVVAEPYFKSLETARRYSGLGKDLGISRVAVLANKVRSAEDETAIGEFCSSHGMELLGGVPHDDALSTAERAGIAPIDHEPEGRSVQAIGRIVGKILGA